MLILRTTSFICSISFLLNCLTHESCKATAIPELTTSNPQTSTKSYEMPQADISKDEVS